MQENSLELPVLDKGFVRYIDHLGSDQRIVETARICYKSPSKGEKQDRGLLKYLLTHNHTTPFESCNITFNIKFPIFCMRQFVRHRTFRLNEMSARYTEMKEEFYFPQKWRKQDIKDKQSSIDGDVGSESQDGRLKLVCNTSYNLYREMIKDGVAKELARIILPINLYTEVYVNCDIHNLMHFFELRLDKHAQWEIQQYAKAMFVIFEKYFPWTAELFKIKNKKLFVE